MPRLKKLLSKFSKKEREILISLIETIISLEWKDLNIKKLKGWDNTFRVRKGKLRIIFIKKGKQIATLTIERRSDTTYK